MQFIISTVFKAVVGDALAAVDALRSSYRKTADAAIAADAAASSVSRSAAVTPSVRPAATAGSAAAPAVAQPVATAAVSTPAVAATIAPAALAVPPAAVAPAAATIAPARAAAPLSSPVVAAPDPAPIAAATSAMATLGSAAARTTAAVAAVGPAAASSSSTTAAASSSATGSLATVASSASSAGSACFAIGNAASSASTVTAGAASSMFFSLNSVTTSAGAAQAATANVGNGAPTAAGRIRSLIAAFFQARTSAVSMGNDGAGAMQRLSGAAGNLRNQLMGVAGAYVGLQAIQSSIGKAVSDRTQLETQTISAAALINTNVEFDGKKSFAKSLTIAQGQLDELAVKARDLPGSFSDYTTIYAAISGPLLAGGAAIDELTGKTADVGVFAKLVGANASDAANQITRMLTGQAGADNPMAMTLKNFGYLKRDFEEFNKLPMKQRVEETFAALAIAARDPDVLAAIANSADTQFSTLKDNLFGIQGILGIAGKTIIDELVTGARRLNEWFERNPNKIREIADMISGTVAPASRTRTAAPRPQPGPQAAERKAPPSVATTPFEPVTIVEATPAPGEQIVRAPAGPDIPAASGSAPPNPPDLVAKALPQLPPDTPPAERLRQNLQAAEEAIRGLPNEHIAAFSQDGNLLREAVGDRTSARLGPGPEDLFRSAIVTHNHPDPGGSFSPDDIVFGILRDLSEMRIATVEKAIPVNYILRPGLGWRNDWACASLDLDAGAGAPAVALQIPRFWWDNFEQARAELAELATNSLPEPDRISAMHRAVDNLARSLGYEYTREEVSR